MRKPRALFMAIDPESFDEPVKDYDFASLSDASSLIDQMATAGGFTATKLAYARDILKDMKAEIDEVGGDPSKVTNWLSFPACLMATGTRGFFHEAVRSQAYNVISTSMQSDCHPNPLCISGEKWSQIKTNVNWEPKGKRIRMKSGIHLNAI